MSVSANLIVGALYKFDLLIICDTNPSGVGSGAQPITVTGATGNTFGNWPNNTTVPLVGGPYFYDWLVFRPTADQVTITIPNMTITGASASAGEIAITRIS